jgi:DNA-directed RNA polymerase subunit RPC12/RpoP
MKTKSYICRVCGKNNPCIIFVGEQEGAPSNCPYFENKEKVKWIEEEIIFSTTIEV